MQNFSKILEINVFSKNFIECLEEKEGNSFQRKETHATFDNKGFHVFENSGTIQTDKLRNIRLDQEGDGTKMFLCAKCCALLGASSVCIRTVDTDVLLLTFYYLV